MADQNKPQFPDDEAFRNLRAGEIDAFHKNIEGRDVVDFSGSDLRGATLKGADLSRVNLRNCYLRDADLSGQDLRDHDLDGCSLLRAKVSGTYFPDDISASEVRLSLEFGIRMRHRKT